MESVIEFISLNIDVKETGSMTFVDDEVVLNMLLFSGNSGEDSFEGICNSKVDSGSSIDSTAFCNDSGIYAKI